MSKSNDRKQSKPLLDENGKFAKGNTPPAGFNVNPQNRHNGAWKKEDTPRYKLEQMMKLSEPELRKVAENKEAPLFERKLATAIAKGQWREIKEMIEQVYGKPKESVDVTSGGETIKALVQFVDENDQDKTS
jgi:hypothetical protein